MRKKSYYQEIIGLLWAIIAIMVYAVGGFGPIFFIVPAALSVWALVCSYRTAGTPQKGYNLKDIPFSTLIEAAMYKASMNNDRGNVTILSQMYPTEFKRLKERVHSELNSRREDDESEGGTGS